jgi:ATP-dependent helicase HrpB
MIIKAQQIANEKEVKYLAQLACMITALVESRDVFNHEISRDDCDLRHRISAVFLKTHNKEQQGHKVNFSVVKNITTQAQQLAKSLFLSMHNLSELPLQYTGALLALAYPERISKSRAEYGQFVSCNGKGLSLSTEDVLANEEYLAVAQIFQQQSNLQIRLAAPVELSILLAWNIAEITSCIHLGYDKNKDRIFVKQQERIGTLVISDKVANEKVSEEQIGQLWCEQVLNQGLDFLPWQESTLVLLARWRWINIHQTHLNLPDVSEPELMGTLEQWLLPFIGHIKSKNQFKKDDLSALLLNLLTYEQQQQLVKVAPTHFVGPAGRKFPIRYSAEASPTVSLPMQELYGEKKTPIVGDVRGGKTIPLILELLSPAKRPIQVTQDLVIFWQGSYHAVQKDMKSQYPRHYWPDDPVNAKPTNKVKRLIEGAK